VPGATLTPGDRRREGDARLQGVGVTTGVLLYPTIRQLKNSCPFFNSAQERGGTALQSSLGIGVGVTTEGPNYTRA